MSQLIGKLDDYALMDEGIYKGSYAAMIDGKPYTIMPHVVPFLLRLEKGIQVDAILNKDKAVSKITKAAAPAADEPAQKTVTRQVPADPLPPGVIDVAGDAVEQAQKRVAAGFHKDTQGPAPAGQGGPAVGTPSTGAAAEPAAKIQPDKTPMGPPAGGSAAAEVFKKIEGAVETIDQEKRILTAIDKDLVVHPIRWAKGYLDEKMAKLKVGYFREFTCEVQKEDLLLTSLKFLDEPQWVKDRYKNARGGGGSRGQPRNEKPMIYESVFKSCCDQAEQVDFQGMTYEKKMDQIWAVAKKISGEIVQLSGA